MGDNNGDGFVCSEMLVSRRGRGCAATATATADASTGVGVEMTLGGRVIGSGMDGRSGLAGKGGDDGRRIGALGAAGEGGAATYGRLGMGKEVGGSG